MSTHSQQYQVQQYTIENILNWVKTDEIAIPEIQRPFVWKKSKVRNLIDSLYKGFPVGYLIIWKNPNVKLKDGGTSEGKKILIDGQQRIIALSAAILGKEITDKKYKKECVKIAFNPIKEEFEVQNPAILNGDEWISDIAPIVNGTASIIQTIKEYCSKNPESDESKVEVTIENLRQIQSKTLGLIELEPDLDIDSVNTIFERVNSEGVTLNNADFVMSKIASFDGSDSGLDSQLGSNLRKLIDYFCHLVNTPDFYPQLIKNDKAFAKTEYHEKIQWLKDEKIDLYKIKYVDLLRVAFASEFERGKIGDLVSLLSGKNFKSRKYEEEIINNSFLNLEKSLLRVTNKHNFQKFLMIISSSGFIKHDLVSSISTLNFAYIVYLKLRDRDIPQAEIESYVRKWFVMSILTGRYSSSIETKFDADVKNIANGYKSHLKNIEETEMSENFWNVALPSELEKSSPNNPFRHTFYASQIKENDKGFLSTTITVREMMQGRGDDHHIFPKNYLKQEKTNNDTKVYNQIANFVYTQSEINNAIKDKPPKEYFGEILEQCRGGEKKYGAITDMKTLKINLKQNCIPESIFNMTIENYHDFLKERRVLMAKKIENYYKNL